MSDHTFRVLLIITVGWLLAVAVIFLIKGAKWLYANFFIGSIRIKKTYVTGSFGILRNKNIKNVVTVNIDGRSVQVRKDHLSKLHMNERDILDR